MNFILILLFLVLTLLVSTDSKSIRTKRNFDTNGKNWETQWNNGTVAYEFHSSLSEQLRQDFFCAINEYHAKTCIRFVPRNGHSVYITVAYDETVCGSASGLKIEVGNACPGSKCGVFIHELGHHLGYAHEQDRPDRDEYIQGPGLAPKREGFETYCLMYDYLSSQHYGSQCEVHGGQWKALKPGVTNCGGGLSVLDANKYNTCYKCKGCLGYRWMGIDCFDAEKHKKVYGGYDVDESKFYVCRGFHNGDIIPGKGSIHKGEWACHVGYAGKEYRLTKFEILTNSNGAKLDWAVTSDLSEGAIAGGRASDGITYYIGRCFVLSPENKWTLAIGKIYANATKKLIIPYNGKEVDCNTAIGYLSCK